jgi:hypothetical protein
MKMLLVLGGAIGLMTSSALGVNPTIVVQNQVLIPNRTGQSFNINVSGGTAVSGVNFNAEVAGGGTANGGTAGPTISGVDLVSGTIFGPNNSGQQSATPTPTQFYSGLVITNSSGTVNAAGKLATVTIDTTGFIGGTYSFKLAGFSNGMFSGDSDFTVAPDYSSIPANITNGNLIVTFPGDANMDGVVNSADAIAMARNWNVQSGATWAMGDFNGDGKVTLSDAQLLQQYFNRSININPGVPAIVSAAAAAVPEPGMLGLIAVLAPMLAMRSRRSK